MIFKTFHVETFFRIKQSEYLNKDLLIIKFKFITILLKIKSSFRFLTEFKLINFLNFNLF